MEALEKKADRLERRIEKFFESANESWEFFRVRTEVEWRELKRSAMRIGLSLRQRLKESAASGENESERR